MEVRKKIDCDVIYCKKKRYDHKSTGGITKWQNYFLLLFVFEQRQIVEYPKSTLPSDSPPQLIITKFLQAHYATKNIPEEIS